MSDVAERVLRTVEQRDLFGPGGHLLVALSGGADSTCLCRVLAELAPSLNLGLSAAYVNHGLRPAENAKEIAFCRNLCRGLGMEFFVEEALVGKEDANRPNLQSHARKLRYAALERRRNAAGADRIAVAHTADDQAETIVMRFIRGSGSRGLAGMPARRGRIVRPLIDVRRGAIESYLNGIGQNWCEDSSNRSARYQRNRVRREIMPLLEKENPGVVGSLLRTASLMAEEDAFLTGEARRCLDDIVTSGSEDAVELDASVFEAMPPVLRRRLVRLVVEDVGGGFGAGIVHSSRAVETLAWGGRVIFPNGVEAERSGGGIRFAKRREAADLNVGFEMVLDVPGSVILPDGTCMSARMERFAGNFGDGRGKAVLDATAVSFPLTVRSRRAGDRMRPLGLGGWKKVQDILVDAKVPRYRRDEIPVVTSGEGDILWLAGLTMDERHRITTPPDRVLVLVRKA